MNKVAIRQELPSVTCTKLPQCLDSTKGLRIISLPVMFKSFNCIKTFATANASASIKDGLLVHDSGGSLHGGFFLFGVHLAIICAHPGPRPSILGHFRDHVKGRNESDKMSLGIDHYGVMAVAFLQHARRRVARVGIEQRVELVFGQEFRDGLFDGNFLVVSFHEIRIGHQPNGFTVFSRDNNGRNVIPHNRVEDARNGIGGLAGLNLFRRNHKCRNVHGESKAEE